MTEVHVVVPAGIDDPARPSGGNTYDRHVVDGLRDLGHLVHVHEVAGAWPHPDVVALAGVAAALAAVPTGVPVLVDGLVGCCCDSVLVREAARLRLVVLVHMPLGPTDAAAAAGERRVLSAAAAVVTPSEWARTQLVSTYALDAGSVHVARPGVDEAAPAPGSATGAELLCVAAVTPHKGHVDLAEALALVTDLPWRCVCAGSLTVDPGHAAHVRGRLEGAGLADRVRLTGPLAGAALDQAYAGADLLVLPSHTETYGMVVGEALARGIPVIATDVGGVPEALGSCDAPGGGRRLPGMLVPAGEPQQLAAALRSWLEDAELRARLKSVALERRRGLPRWSDTVTTVSRVLDRLRRP